MRINVNGRKRTREYPDRFSPVIGVVSQRSMATLPVCAPCCRVQARHPRPDISRWQGGQGRNVLHEGSCVDDLAHHGVAAAPPGREQAALSFCIVRARCHPFRTSLDGGGGSMRRSRILKNGARATPKHGWGENIGLYMGAIRHQRR